MLVFLFQQTNCSGTVKQDAHKAIPFPRTYKRTFPCVFGKLLSAQKQCRSDVERSQNETSQHHWNLGTLAPSTAPPHMPDMTVLSLQPPHPPLWEYVCSRPTSRPSDKQDKAGWNWEKLRMTGWWQWAHIVRKTQTADTHTQIRKQEIWKGSNEECLEHA